MSFLCINCLIFAIKVPPGISQVLQSNGIWVVDVYMGTVFHIVLMLTLALSKPSPILSLA